MRRALALSLLVLGGASGLAAWWLLGREEPVSPPPAERGYGEIDRAEYEKWMQDLGYTD